MQLSREPDLSFRQALRQHEAGRLEQAEAIYRRILAREPQHPGALLYLGVAHYDRRQFDEAIRLISRSIEANPREPGAYNHMGLALLARRELPEAVQQFEKALRLKPGHLDAKTNLANALKKLKQLERAETLFREVIAADPRNVFAHHNLGLLLFDRRRFEEAERELLETLELAPDFHKTHYLLGQAAENMGRFADAAARYETVLQLAPEHHPAMAALLALRDYQPSEAIIEKAERMAALDDLPDPEGYTLCYGLAKRFEKRQVYDRAFRYLELANRRRSRGRRYDHVRVDEVFGHYRSTFTREFIARHAPHGSDSERPVFIVGMPRTGTTLTEQILAAHPDVYGVGELPDLPNVTNQLAIVIRRTLGRELPVYPLCLEALSAEFMRPMIDYYLGVLGRHDAVAPRVVDKNPFNFINVGLIAVLFPRARIIHCHRDPLDVAISCYTELFELKQDFTTDFGNFAHYYGHYRRLMQHWREALDMPILDAPYESLIADPEQASRRVVEFCGLPWDDACLAFQQTDRPVLTPSKWQVRQPIYRSSLGRWRNYAAHIGPLREALARNGVPV